MGSLVCSYLFRGDTHMTSTLRGLGWGVRQKWDGRRFGGSECSWRPIFVFFIKVNWICTMTRYAESNNILLVSFWLWCRQWYHCIVCGLNRTTENVVNLNVTWLGFCFDFVRSHARCCCCSTVCWRRWRGVKIRRPNLTG